VKTFRAFLLLSVLFLAMPCRGTAQRIPAGPKDSVLERMRSSIFLRMIEARAHQGGPRICLGLGGENGLVEDPSPSVLEEVRAGLDEVLLNPALFPYEVRPFSECDESNFDPLAPIEERGQPFLITGLYLSSETEAMSQGHASLGPGEAFDCVLGLEAGFWDFRFCRVMHRHHGGSKVLTVRNEVGHG